MKRAATVSLLAVVAGLTLTSSLHAQAKSAKHDRQQTDTQELVGFTSLERKIIVEFFAEHTYQAKPLPPGIAKNLARGKPLPPGIAKTRLPEKLQARLPARAGIEITIFGDRIVLLEASGLVVDVLEGIFG